MYKKILVPYDKSDPAKNALGAALDLAAGVPGAQITVLSVVDWHDFNAETFKIASRMSGVMGDTMDMDVISEVENEAIKADMDAIAENIAPLVGDAEGIGIAVVNGSPHDSITAYADGCIGLHAPIRVRYGKEIYMGKGISTDVIESSILSYINAINRILADYPDAIATTN